MSISAHLELPGRRFGIYLSFSRRSGDATPAAGSRVRPEPLPTQCIKKGLHGGGFGPHPRGEVRGIARAITGLLRPQTSSPPDSVPVQRLKSENAVIATASPQPFRRTTKAKIPGKPWSRLDQALRVTDLLLQNGGFGAIVLDLGGIAPEHVLRIPLATWFRYRALAEQQHTSVLLLSQHGCAKSSAALQVHLRSSRALGEGATVFSGTEHHIEVTRERFSPVSGTVIPLRKSAQSQKHAYWQSRTVWTGR